MFRNILVTIFFIGFYSFISQAQTWNVRGRVTDAFTHEPVAGAYIAATNDTCFAFSDANGNFSINITSSSQALKASASGYLPVTIPVKFITRMVVNFELTASAVKMAGEARGAATPVVEKYIRKIYENREINNPVFNSFFSYRCYEKLQFELNDINDELKQKPVLRPFATLLNDSVSESSNALPDVPFFFTESVTDVYHRNKPLQKIEQVRASRSAGVENLTLMQLLKDIYRNVAVYDDYVNVLGKSFISPVSKEGMKHYRYEITDSTFIEGRKVYRVNFYALSRFELTFNGNFWFHDTTFALQRITLLLDKSARINFVEDFAFVKVFRCIAGGKWVPDHEQMIVKFSTRQKGMHVSARRSKNYWDHRLGENPGDSVFQSQSAIRFDPEAFDRSADFWRDNRHENLTHREEKIFVLVDSLKKMPAFQIYVATVVVALTGHVQIGKIDYGPYYHLLSNNSVEGYRFRFGGRTNDKFSERWRLEGYGAYGFSDERFKYMGGLRYTIRKKPFMAAGYQYKHDLVQPGLHEWYFKDEGFITILYRRNPSDQLTNVEGHKLYYDASFRSGLTLRIQYLNNFYTPENTSFSFYRDASLTDIQNNLHVSEFWLNLRYSYLEKFIEKKNKRVSLGTDYPVFQINIIKGLNNFLDGEFNYLKIAGRITHKLNLFPYGKLHYALEAGKVFGTVPYPLLYIQRGNESVIYDYTAFNLMNHYEFITDRYFIAGGVHHFDGWLWRRIPLLRKLDWRELISARILFGQTSHANKNLLLNPEAVSVVRTKPYIEAGAGLENIFKLFRVDALWRLTYREKSGTSDFGIRISAQLLF